MKRRWCITEPWEIDGSTHIRDPYWNFMQPSIYPYSPEVTERLKEWKGSFVKEGFFSYVEFDSEEDLVLFMLRWS